MRPSFAPPESGLATPLSEVTFVVIDLETTGTTPGQSRVIEVGAAKYRGGECLGTFQTLVNPGCAVPPFVVVLTGITDGLVLPAPAIEEVLPSLLEFVGDSVLVGHHLRFDTSFLDIALATAGRPQLGQARVDTLALARLLLAGEVPDRRLSTLARFFGTAAQPTHRALDDALATAEVFHGLLERAAGFGVLALEDLVAFQARLPRCNPPGRTRRAYAYLKLKLAAERIPRLGRAKKTTGQRALTV
jgi:DNA polymerase III subunit epsilon